MSKERTDTERLDAMENMAISYGKGWILRYSRGYRGLRLHQTTSDGACKDIRVAIDKFLDSNVLQAKQDG